MPKVIRKRQIAKTAVDTNPKKKTLKEKKEEKRADFLDRLHQTKRSIQVDKSVKKYGHGLGNTSNLAEAISQYAQETRKIGDAKKKQTKMTNKRRKNLAMKEVSLFNQVLVHPAFKMNPSAAIGEHLKNTLLKHTDT